MKTYRLAEAKKLLKVISEFLDDNMGWIVEGGEQDKDLFVLSNEMNCIRGQINNFFTVEGN